MARDSRGDEPGGCLAIFFLLLLVGLVILAVVWFVSFVGHVLELTPTYPETSPTVAATDPPRSSPRPPTRSSPRSSPCATRVRELRRELERRG
ncbi:MAG TPA: hypothetical protein VGJ32_05985 [Solirubrobacteraceae bacterium]